MATQHVRRTEIWDPVLALVVDFLDRSGIPPRDLAEYREEDLIRAILAQDWEVDIEAEADPPGWGVEIRKWWKPGQRQEAYGSGPDRVSALIDALGDTLTLLTAEESVRHFDEMARELLNMSGTEFIAKYQANELDRDDSRVVHLHISRPVGW